MFFDLTDEEKKNFKEKIDILIKFGDEFTSLAGDNYSIENAINSVIRNKFTFKEIMSDEIANLKFKNSELEKNIYQFDSNKLKRYLMNYNSFNTKTLTDNDKKDIIQYFQDNYLNNMKSIDNDTFSVLFSLSGYSADFLIYCMKTKKITIQYMPNVITYINNMMATSNNLNEIIDILKDSYPEYDGYPIVILNPNIESAEKIKIIKKTYIQKNLNHYSRYIRNNIKDMNDLDAFIEATVLQNNHVKNKSDGVINITRRIIVGMCTDYYKFNLESKLHATEFLNKYKKYYDGTALRSLYSYSANYSQTGEIEDLITTLYKDSPIVDRLNLAAACPKADFLISSNYDALYTDPNSTPEIKDSLIKFYTSKSIANNGTDLLKIYKNIITTFSSEETQLEILDKSFEIFKPKIQNYDIIAEADSYGSYGGINFVDSLKDMIKFLPKNYIESSFNIHKDSLLSFNTFHHNSSDLGGSLFIYYYFTALNNLLTSHLTNIDKHDLAVLCFNKYLNTYYNDDNSSESLNALSKIINEKNYSSYSLNNFANREGITKNFTISDYLKDYLLKSVKDLSSTCMNLVDENDKDKFIKINNNIDELTTNLEILNNL